MAKINDFKQPPWVIGSQKEVMEWIEATHPSKDHKKRKHTKKNEFLKNLNIQLDLDVENNKHFSSNIIIRRIQQRFGLAPIEEHFDLSSTAEIIIRGLAKAGFRNTSTIIMDNKVLYNHPEIGTDLRKSIEIIRSISDGYKLEFVAVLSDIKKCYANVNIKKLHKKKDHAINIFLKGEINSNLYHTFINYLNENLGFKKD